MIQVQLRKYENQPGERSGDPGGPAGINSLPANPRLEQQQRDADTREHKKSARKHPDGAQKQGPRGARPGYSSMGQAPGAPQKKGPGERESRDRLPSQRLIAHRGPRKE